jgi:hypothetical protein
MNQQVARLSPHQNGKVVAVLMAILSVLFLLPFSVIYLLASPSRGGPPLLAALVVPIVYLVIGYLSVLISCAVYNALFPYIGGLEFEARSGAAERP